MKIHMAKIVKIKNGWNQNFFHKKLGFVFQNCRKVINILWFSKKGSKNNAFNVFLAKMLRKLNFYRGKHEAACDRIYNYKHYPNVCFQRKMKFIQCTLLHGIPNPMKIALADSFYACAKQNWYFLGGGACQYWEKYMVPIWSHAFLPYPFREKAPVPQYSHILKNHPAVQLFLAFSWKNYPV